MLIIDLIKANPGKKIHELITEESWCQDHGCVYPDGTGESVGHEKACKMCLTYWLWAVIGVLDETCAKIVQEIGLVSTDLRKDLEEIINWNDTPGRTLSEVHALLKKLDL